MSEVAQERSSPIWRALQLVFLLAGLGWAVFQAVTLLEQLRAFTHVGDGEDA